MRRATRRMIERLEPFAEPREASSAPGAKMGGNGEDAGRKELPARPRRGALMLGRFIEDVSAAIQDATGKDKINAFLDHLGIQATFNASVAADIKLFIKIRNLAYHHSPKVIPINIYPDPIIEITNRLKCQQGQAVWTIYLEHIQVVEWGREAVLNFVEEFERLEKLPASALYDAFNGWVEMRLE